MVLEEPPRLVEDGWLAAACAAVEANDVAAFLAEDMPREMLERKKDAKKRSVEEAEELGKTDQQCILKDDQRGSEIVAVVDVVGSWPWSNYNIYLYTR